MPQFTILHHTPVAALTALELAWREKEYGTPQAFQQACASWVWDRFGVKAGDVARIQAAGSAQVVELLIDQIVLSWSPGAPASAPRVAFYGAGVLLEHASRARLVCSVVCPAAMVCTATPGDKLRQLFPERF